MAFQWDTTAAVPLWWRDDEFRLFGPAEVLVPPRDGSMLDHTLIENALIKIHERNPIGAVVMDISHQGEYISTWLESELGCLVIARPQTLPQQVEEFERFMEALRHGWLFHAGDAGLTRHALNAIARALPRGDRVFERPVQGSRMARGQDLRVIDALKAAAMVHATRALGAGGDVVFSWGDGEREEIAA